MSSPPPTIDYQRKWQVMAAVASGIFLATIDGSIVNIALPTLVQSFQADFPIVQWVVLSYLLVITSLILSMGRLGDMLGKKPVYITGFVIFTLGSLLCGLAPSIYWLIGFRMFQGIGAAMLMSLGTAILTEAFPPQERGKALGIGGSMVSIGIVTGPVLGGLIVDTLGWHWIFFVNLPVGIIGTFLAVRFVPRLRPVGRQSFDFLGAASLFVSLACLLLALTFGQELGFNAPPILALLGAWLTFLVLFLTIERQSSQPMVDLSLFQSKIVSTNLLLGFTIFITLAGTGLLMPFYLENVLGYPPRSIGLLLAIQPIMLGIVAPVAGTLSDRFGSRSITTLGLLILLGGYIGLSTLSSETTALGYILRFIPVGIGVGVFQSPNNSSIMGAVPPHRLGITSGLLALSRTLGQTTGIAVLGALWAGWVAWQMRGLPGGGATSAPAEVQAAALGNTFGVAAALIGLALLLGSFSWLRERRMALGERKA